MRYLVVLMMSLGLLASCSSNWATDYDSSVPADTSRNWRVASLDIRVPDTLTVSENTALFAPNADIVWFGDPPGDRRAQVRAILRDGIGRGVDDLRGRQRVRMVVVLTQFHAVTPTAVNRAPSAVHNIAFAVQVFDMAGNPLIEQQFIRADLEANVGVSAVVAAQQGQTQKVRITDHLERVMQGWLGIGPDPRRSFGSLGR